MTSGNEIVNLGRLGTALTLCMRKLLDVAPAFTNVSVYKVLTGIRKRRFSHLRIYPLSRALTKIYVYIYVYVVLRMDERRKRIKRYPFTDVNVYLCTGAKFTQTEQNFPLVWNIKAKDPSLVSLRELLKTGLQFLNSQSTLIAISTAI